jgi:hypothetical protein
MQVQRDMVICGLLYKKFLDRCNVSDYFPDMHYRCWVFGLKKDRPRRLQSNQVALISVTYTPLLG